MKHLVWALVATLTVASSSIAQDVKQESPLSSWQGYLVDAKSAPEMLKDPETAMKNAAEYTKSSALREENQRSGFGIVAGGKWLRFDKAGNERAVEFLRATKKEKGIIVTVSGKLDGETVAVVSIKPYLPDNSAEVY